MKARIQWVGDACSSVDRQLDHAVVMDGPPESGGHPTWSVRPMEMVLIRAGRLQQL
jgi:putative redox protein